MGKHKKTREQKRAADLRRFSYSQQSLVSQESVQKEPEAPSPTFSFSFAKTATVTTLPSYALSHDLRKTVLVSFGILLFLLCLSTLLKTHAVVLPLESLRY